MNIYIYIHLSMYLAIYLSTHNVYEAYFYTKLISRKERKNESRPSIKHLKWKRKTAHKTA